MLVSVSRTVAALGAVMILGGCFGHGSNDQGDPVSGCLFGLGWLEAMITSRPEVPNDEIANREASPEEFVESSADIFFRSRDEGVFRIGLDGGDRRRISDRDYPVYSMSRGGDTVVLKDPRHYADVRLYLFREGDEEPAPFPPIDYEEGLAVSPGGGLVGYAERSKQTGGDTFAVKVMETTDMEIRTLRAGIESEPEDVGWSADGSRLLFRFPDRVLQYRPSDDELSRIESGSVDWSRLHGADSVDPRSCELGGETVRLEDPAAEDEWGRFEGLELVYEDGSTEPLVEVELPDGAEDVDNPRTPFADFFFVPDCDYAVFTEENEDAIRVVDLDSKTVGTISAGEEAWPIPGS